MMHQNQQHAAAVAAFSQSQSPALGLLASRSVLPLLGGNPLVGGLIGQPTSSNPPLVAPLAGAPLLMSGTANGTRLKSAADSPPERRIDPNAYFNVFVGDLSPEVDNEVLARAFEKFGLIVEAKVMRDAQSMKSRSFGFVAFARQEDAARAIEEMNGQPVGKRAVRTNWATRRTAESRTDDHVRGRAEGGRRREHFGLQADLRTNFEKFGTIKQIRLFSPKNYGFVVFDTKENAARAILEMSGQEIRGQTLTCSWGKSSQDQSKAVNPVLSLAGMNANPVANHLHTFPTALLSQLYQPNAFLQSWHV
ncbi:hypothetical protein M3Y99_00316700 [Aphelenchoides fujianensis]|nr:hypothetical protein M3Y99_00316700 [Aphelenchoides fujianensis]